MSNIVFVFTGEGSNLPSGVFLELETAEKWIARYSLSGMLTIYPVNTGVYNWAIDNKHFQVRNENHSKPGFIQRFTSASLEHYHFENGARVS